MFHWKGHECLIICVIDAAFLFVSKCERLFRVLCVYFCTFCIRLYVCACGTERDLRKFTTTSLSLSVWNKSLLPLLPCDECIMKSIKNVIWDHYWVCCVKYHINALSQNKTTFFFFFFEVKQKVKATFSWSWMNKPGCVSKLWFVGLKAAVLVFELTARFDHN